MRIAIIGAGALGGGFVAPLLSGAGHQVFTIDTSTKATTHSFWHSGNIVKSVPTSAIIPITMADLDSVKPSVIFTCTNPPLSFAEEQVLAARSSIWVPLENTPRIPRLLNFYPIRLGVADVLAVSTPDAHHSEAPGIGRLLLDSSLLPYLDHIPGITYYDPSDMPAIWAARFLTHNTGHATLAFLGRLHHYTHIHQAALDPTIAAIATGAMTEAGLALCSDLLLQNALNIISIPHLSDWRHYASTEVARYTAFTPDTIQRVARNPLPKLALDERLIAPALAHLRSLGSTPTSLITAIAATLLALDPEDNIYLPTPLLTMVMEEANELARLYTTPLLA